MAALMLLTLVLPPLAANSQSYKPVTALNGIVSGDTYCITAYYSSNYYTVPKTTISGQTFTCTQGEYNSTTQIFTPDNSYGEFVFTAVEK